MLNDSKISLTVNISCAGRFFAPELAAQLHRVGQLGTLYTGYPKYRISEIPRERIVAFPFISAMTHLPARIGLRRLSGFLNPGAVEIFDRIISRSLKECDVFHCWSSMGLYTHRLARSRYGALTVCDRGSSHILFQEELLED